MKFSIHDFFSKCDQITEEILNGKLHFLCHDNNNDNDKNINNDNIKPSLAVL